MVVTGLSVVVSQILAVPLHEAAAMWSFVGENAHETTGLVSASSEAWFVTALMSSRFGPTASASPSASASNSALSARRRSLARGIEYRATFARNSRSSDEPSVKKVP